MPRILWQVRPPETIRWLNCRLGLITLRLRCPASRSLFGRVSRCKRRKPFAWDATLKVGSAAESVTVTEAVLLLKTESGELSQTVSTQTMATKTAVANRRR